LTNNLRDYIEEVYLSHNMVDIPNSFNRYISSIGCHTANQMNIKHKRFFSAGQLENFRTNVVTMAPSGFNKTTMMEWFLNKKYGVLSKVDPELMGCDMLSTASKESWMGTMVKNAEMMMAVKGILGIHKKNIVGMDDFQRLASMMEGTGVNNDEVYLMIALEKDSAVKRLAWGELPEDDIGMTLWAGMRPQRIELVSGLARRFSFQLYYPTDDDIGKFKHAVRDNSNSSVLSDEIKLRVAGEVASLYDELSMVEVFDYTKVNNWIDSMGVIPHFEEKIYRRLALGYNIMCGCFPGLSVDKSLDSLLRDELKNRAIIREDPESEAVLTIVRSRGHCKLVDLEHFFRTQYQFSRHKFRNCVLKLRGEESILIDGPRGEELVYEVKGDRRCSVFRKPKIRVT